MPNKDGTGPCSKGPKSGNQRGNCQGAQPLENEITPREGKGCGKHKRLGQGRCCDKQ